MKILTLDLIAFGPFTGERLDLGAGREGVHLVYGPNEAGKSSALRALEGALFGIPLHTDDNFVHKHADLRVGVKLINSRGREIHFIRRKGKINTLRGPDDTTVLADEVLFDCLGGIEADEFHLRFGIDHASLREGGASLTGGRVESSLVLSMAGTGLPYRATLDALESEMADLFKSRGQKMQINQLLDDIDKLRNDRDARLLSRDTWISHRHDLEAAESDAARLREDMVRTQAELDRFRRIRTAAPFVAAWKKSVAAAKQLEGAPILPVDAGHVYLEARTTVRTTDQSLRHAILKIAEFESELESLAVPSSIKACLDELNALPQEVGAYKGTVGRIPGLCRTIHGLESQVLARMRELGLGQEVAKIEDLRPQLARKSLVVSLEKKYASIQLALKDSESRIQDNAVELEQLDAEITSLSPEIDPSPLRIALSNAQKHGAIEVEHHQRVAEIEAAEAVFHREVLKLPHWIGSPDELVMTAVPQRADIDRFCAEVQKAEHVRDDLAKQLSRIARQVEEIDVELSTKGLVDPVPLVEQLQHARIERDRGWSLVRSSWKDRLDVREEVERYVRTRSGAQDLEEAYLASVRQVDELANRLIDRAKEVAQRNERLGRREELDRQRQGLERELARASHNLHALLEKRAILWPDSVKVQLPTEMQTWLDQHALLMGQWKGLEERRAEVSRLTEWMSQARRELDDARSRLGLPDLSEEISFSTLVNRCAADLERLTSIASRRENLRAERKKTEAKRSREAKKAKGAAEELKAWESDWSRTTAWFDGQGALSPVGVSERITDLEKLFGQLDLVAEKKRELFRLEEERVAFEQSVRELAGRVGIDPGTLTIEALCDELLRMAIETNEKLSRHKTVKKARTDTCVGRDNLVETQQRAQARLASLFDLAGCREEPALATAIERSDSRRRLQAQLDEEEKTLLDLGAGRGIDTLLTEVDSVPLDGLSTVIEDRTRALKSLEELLDKANVKIGESSKQLSLYSSVSEAASVAGDLEEKLTELESAARRYATLKMASFALRESMTSYRECHGGPIIARAGEFFRALCDGSFERVVLDENEKGLTVVFAIRAGSGKRLTIDDMSEGTRDQLYLALRLASLEEHFKNRETLPFIVDDILLNFDDQRATAALSVLGEFSRTTQVVFFTHHQHLVEIARRAVPSELLFEHRLEPGTR